jgi:hypothetical protein
MGAVLVRRPVGAGVAPDRRAGLPRAGLVTSDALPR